MTAVFSLPPLVDVAHSNTPVGASLGTPIAYDVIAPLSNVLDALTLLSPAQDWATLGLVAVAFLGFLAYGTAPPGTKFTPTRTVRAALNFGGGTIGVIGIMLVVSRPMASLALRDRDLIAIDFHSHTDASHDGRSGFDAEKNREWHSSAGFDAAYVTDHRTFDGALAGEARNPGRCGDRTVLLSGVELRDRDEHPILIGVDPRRMRITSPDWKGAAVEADGGPVPPILLLSMPGDILRIPLDETVGPVRIAAVEVSDGSPRGLAQSGLDREAILALADRLHLALVSASDNHGWGRTAAAWSVLRIPGWRDMTPARLDIAIRRTLVTEGSRATEVIARRTASPSRNDIETALGGVAVGLVMLRTMSPTDRVSWALWSWSLCLLSLRRAHRRREKLRISNKRAKGKSRQVVDAAA